MAGAPPPASATEAVAREAARTARLEQLHATLTAQVAAIRDGDDWQRWLAVAARFPDYSLNNVLLIAAQRPDATAVAGFGAWKALGRHVDKGAKGIAILAPVLRRPPDDQGAAGNAMSKAAVEQPPGNPATATQVGAASDQSAASGAGQRVVGGFRVVYVFDVSQTSGRPLPERPAPALLAGQAPPGLWDALAAQVQARDFTLRRGDCGGANGLTHYIDRTVTVRPDVDDAQAVKTLAHELGHVLLHDPTGLASLAPPGMALAAGDPVLTPEAVETSIRQCRGRLEVEAESLAFLVASAHGLDTGVYTFAYVAGWAAEVPGVEIEQVVRGTANRVLAAAKVVLGATEHRLEQAAGAGARAQAVTGHEQHHDPAMRGGQGATVTDAPPDTPAQPQQTGPAASPAPAPKPAAPVTAERSGVPVPAGPSPERLVEVHAVAVDFYADRLIAGGPDARRAQELLTGRGFDPGTVSAARLGYAPRTWTALVDHLRDRGVNDDELLASGLVLRTSRAALVDRFRDRVIFPIDTAGGQTVALLGRAVDDSATDRQGAPVPKYLNSPETALYRKREHLYGLRQGADAVTAGAIPVLVEGPMDVLAVNQAGTAGRSGKPAHFGVAPCGTALTAQQVQRLDALTGGLGRSGVVTAFDGDGAGHQASLRAYELLREARAWPTVLVLPVGHDPAAMAADRGAVWLHAALLASAATPLADLVVDARIDRHPLRWAEGRVAAGRDAAAVVAAMPPEHVSRQIVRIIGRTGLPPRTVSDLVVDAVTRPSRQPANRRPPALAAPATSARPAEGNTAAPPGPSPAQHAKAGFPVALRANLQPPGPMSESPPPPPATAPAPEQQHRWRTSR